MKCPFCGEPDTRVVDSRPSDDDNRIKRRRECSACGRRFTTFESVESTPLLVVKKDGSRQLFDKEKLLRSMLKACEKRPVSYDDLSDICDRIERTLSNGVSSSEVNTEMIGELVMEELKKKDKVAYVRFASVYKDFRDIDTFVQVINEINSSES